MNEKQKKRKPKDQMPTCIYKAVLDFLILSCLESSYPSIYINLKGRETPIIKGKCSVPNCAYLLIKVSK